MNVVAHQAIGIEKTEWWQLQPLLVIPVSQSSEDGDHLLVVLIVLKDILTVDASEHHVVNSRTALFPNRSCHRFNCFQMRGQRYALGSAACYRRDARTYSRTSKYST